VTDNQQSLAQSARHIADKLNAAISAAVGVNGAVLTRFTAPPTIQDQLDEVRRVKDSRDRTLADLHYLSQIPLTELQARFADTSTAELIDERSHYAQHGVFRGEPVGE